MHFIHIVNLNLSHLIWLLKALIILMHFKIKLAIIWYKNLMQIGLKLHLRWRKVKSNAPLLRREEEHCPRPFPIFFVVDLYNVCTIIDVSVQYSHILIGIGILIALNCTIVTTRSFPLSVMEEDGRVFTIVIVYRDYSNCRGLMS